MGKGCYWWSEYGDFPPEDERERAPSPSAILESYRIAGNVKFSQLAEEMDLSEKMARRIFHQEGLSSVPEILVLLHYKLCHAPFVQRKRRIGTLESPGCQTFSIDLS